MIKIKLKLITSLLIVTFLLILSTSCDILKKESPEQVYNREMAVFKKNESETLPFYGTLKTTPRNTLLLQLESKIIPKWKQNEEIVKRLTNLEGLSGNLKILNQKYRKYTEMRLKSMELLRKAMSENTGEYSSQIENLEQDINTLLESI